MNISLTTGSQIGVAPPTALEVQSRVVGYDKRLRMKALVTDIWSKLSGIYNPERQSLPDAIKMMVGANVLSDSLEAVITMKLKLRAGGVLGNNFAIGTEERPVTKAFKIYCNNLRKVVDTPGYGRRNIEAKPYGLYEQHVEDLGDWNKEMEGLEIRQTVVERYGETLIYGDTAATCVRNWNPNIFICGRGSHYRNAQPAYSTNRNTYTQNIVAGVIAAGGGSLTPTNTQVLNQVNASHLQNMAIAQRITPISIPGLPGGKGYVVLISELQAMYFGDPAWANRNFGDLWRDIGRQNDLVMKWPGVIGSWKKLLFVEDPRMPTLIPTGTNQPYGLSAGYLWPGDVDERERDNSDVIDCFMLCGQAAVVTWTPEKLHHIQMSDDYGAIMGHGTALVRGCQMPVYDQQTPGVGTQEQYSSILGLARLPAYV